TACRISEITGLQLENVNLEERTARVIGKGNKERIVPMTRRAAETLKLYLRERTSGFVFIAEPTIQFGGVSRDKWGTWRGYWREQCPGGKVVMRSIRLGDYELRTRDEAAEALDRHLAKNPPPLHPCSSKAIDNHTIRSILNEAARHAGLPYHVHP